MYTTSNTPIFYKTSGVIAGLVVLAGLIALFWFLLKRDGNNTKRDLDGENMQGIGQSNVSQPAMVSLDQLRGREIGHSGEDVPTNMRQSMGSASEYTPDVDLHPRAVDIKAPETAVQDPARFGNLVRNVEDQAEGQGVIQDMSISGHSVPREYVEYGILENKQFYPRINEFPVHEKPHVFDPTNKPPRSHFGPMTYPLAGPIGPLGMDVMRSGNTDTRVNIAATGGRH